MRKYIALPLALLAQPAWAQKDTTHEIGEEDSIAPATNEIVVIATRMKGVVDAPQQPIATLDENTITSYGASSIADLLDALSPQTGSGRGRGSGAPVMLLNGQRISSFREMMALSPEAIKRIEILPEEVSLRYGFPPNQRVINMILKDNFSNRSLEVEYHVPGQGGYHQSELQGSLLRINGPGRLIVSGDAKDTSMLTEAERDLRQPTQNVPTVPTDPDPARYRSLIDDSRNLSLTGAWSTGLGSDGKNGSLALNSAITRADSRSLSGLDMVTLVAPDGQSARRSLAGPLVSTSRTNSLAGGVTLNKPIGDWLFTATADGTYSDTLTDTDREGDSSALVAAAAAGTLPIDGILPALANPGADRIRTRDTTITSLATVTGRPFAMPAGQAFLTVKAGLDYNRSANSDTRSAGRTTLDRSDISGGFSLALPLTSRRDHVLSALGDLTLTFGAGIDHLSDFGTLKDWNAGITWNVTDRLGLMASYIVNEAAPTLSQLGGAQQYMFNVPVFDFTRGETALVTVLTGGNPDLQRERQRDLKFSANWSLPFIKDSNLVVDYFRNRSQDVTQAFPLLTPAVEAAFPGRAVRDADGRLISIDRSPVTFARTEGSRLRWGINLTGTIGKAQPGGAGAPPPPGGPGGPPAAGGIGAPPAGGAGAPPMGMGGPPPAGMGAMPSGGGGRPGGMGPGGMGRGGGGINRLMGGGAMQGRWNLSVYHTLRFTERALIARGIPMLDLLHGDALTVGGVPRNEIEVEGGFFYRGFGVRANGTWRAPVDVQSDGAPGSGDLRFGSTFVLNARLFLNMEGRKQWVERMPLLKGVRIALEFDNVLDSRQKVTDASGVTPLSYQRAYRDPRGRVIGIDIRKMF